MCTSNLQFPTTSNEAVRVKNKEEFDLLLLLAELAKFRPVGTSTWEKHNAETCVIFSKNGTFEIEPFPKAKNHCTVLSLIEWCEKKQIGKQTLAQIIYDIKSAA